MDPTVSRIQMFEKLCYYSFCTLSRIPISVTLNLNYQEKHILKLAVILARPQR
jgi:hypothetical protein